MDDNTPSKIDLLHAESRVIFYFCNCSLHKNLSFYGLNRVEAEKLIKRLQHIEKMTWGQLAALPREKGLTPDRPGSGNFDMIHGQDSSEQQLVELYYFHLRIEETGLFRVFGYQKGQLFCITHIDPKGKINH
jgi:hypothetical protein